jgi:hypothetical protein
VFEYLPEVGEFIVATADFQAFVPGGRPRNIKLNMQMKVRKFNMKGDALVDSHVYSQVLLKILKSDFNKIEHSQNRTLTEIFVEPDPNGSNYFHYNDINHTIKWTKNGRHTRIFFLRKSNQI